MPRIPTYEAAFRERFEPLVGTVMYFLLCEWLSDLGSIYMVALGVLTVGVMRFATGGIWVSCSGLPAYTYCRRNVRCAA